MKVRLKGVFPSLLLGIILSVLGWWWYVEPKVARSLKEDGEASEAGQTIKDRSEVSDSNRLIMSSIPAFDQVTDLSVATRERRKNFDQAESIGSVSLIAILANPLSFHGKRVIVRGYAVVEFEHQSIYPSRDLAISSKNGIWIDGEGDPRMNFLFGKGLRPVFLEAVYDAYEGGHLGMSTGSFFNISRLFLEDDVMAESK